MQSVNRTRRTAARRLSVVVGTLVVAARRRWSDNSAAAGFAAPAGAVPWVCAATRPPVWLFWSARRPRGGIWVQQPPRGRRVRLLNAAFTTGSGSGTPTGIVTVAGPRKLVQRT
jgi:hypothetical protein